jgi:C4-dicarboxylate-specific signal transduction histidine kinase
MSEVPDDRRVLTIACRRSELNAKPAVSLFVQDCGCGFEVKEPERIFHPFYTTKPHGMGMGLRICLSIVEAHGGRMTAS